MGGIYGCGKWVSSKEVYRCPNITYPYILLLYLLFFAASLLFVHFVKMFFSFLFMLFLYNFIINNYW